MELIMQRYPMFIERNGDVLVLKAYEYLIEKGKFIVRDLPRPGQLPEYMNREQMRLWQEKNKRVLEDARKNANRR